jgi:hypothetical protein
MWYHRKKDRRGKWVGEIQMKECSSVFSVESKAAADRAEIIVH